MKHFINPHYKLPVVDEYNVMSSNASDVCGASKLWVSPMFMNGYDILVMVNHHNTNVQTIDKLLIVCKGIRVGITLFTSLHNQ